ncbi:MAG: hypothetical protein K0U79_05770 [Gammaproteobacteria bacterium]|nr:hypothetical protein [Gammaproteobacteria bacterium]
MLASNAPPAIELPAPDLNLSKLAYKIGYAMPVPVFHATNQTLARPRNIAFANKDWDFFYFRFSLLGVPRRTPSGQD